MPWTAQDADKHVKGLSKKQKRKWAAIANSVLEACQGQEGGEAKALKIANSKFEMAKTNEEFAKRNPEFIIPFNPVFKPAIEEALRLMTVNEKKIEEAELVGIQEMEIFRTGTHNGEPFEDQDLLQIVENFNALKNDIRPKLKITHDKNQRTLAGLASYGDIIDVYIRAATDGTKRLFATIINVPKKVADWIKERRFPERSIELYGKLKLGTSEDGKVYRNVLKAIALLGSEMPAVPGMEPIKLAESIETQNTICFGEVCFPCEEAAQSYKNSLIAANAIADMLEKKFS